MHASSEIEVNRMWSYHFIWSNTKWSLAFFISFSPLFAKAIGSHRNLIFRSGYAHTNTHCEEASLYTRKMTARLRHKTNLTSSRWPIERQSMAIKNLSACFENVFGQSFIVIVVAIVTAAPVTATAVTVFAAASVTAAGT